MSEDKLRLLFTLGEVAHAAPWPDYLAYGFTRSDVPLLIGLVGDQSLHGADVDSADVWVPLHAWRVLGQLGSEACVEPLLSLLDEGLVDDDWARDELPTVLGMVGEAAIDGLGRYFADGSRGEYSRAIAAEALKSVVERCPQSRARVLDIFSAYLASPDNSAAELNGLLLCCLIDLRAVESLDAVQQLFESGCVDVSYAGQFEEVKRAMTAPAVASHAVDKRLNEALDETSGETIYDEIDRYLKIYQRPTAVVNSSELDGFFAALGCTPEKIGAEAWLAAIWGGVDYLPQWSDKEEEQRFVSAVLVAYNRVVRSLNADTFAALYLARPQGAGTALVADDWCQGFLRGVNMWGALPRADALFLEKSLKPIRLFSTQIGRQALAAMSAAEVASAQRSVEASVRAMYQHWLAPRDVARTPVLASPKTGRNDPCGCGSGRKFKKCCLH